MNIVGFFTTIYLSFFSKNFYRAVYSSWQGFAFKYLFFLTILSSISTIIVWTIILFKLNSLNFYQAGYDDRENLQDHRKENHLTQTIKALIDQIPDIIVEKYEFHVEQEIPINIYYPNTNYIIGVIDTKAISSTYNNNPLFKLTKNEIIINSGGRQLINLQASDIIKKFNTDTILIDKFFIYNMIIDSIKKLNFIFPLLLIPAFILFNFVSSILWVLLIAVIGMVTAKLLNTQVEYNAIVRLAVVAMAPAIIIQILLGGVIPFLIIAINLITFFIALNICIFQPKV